MYGAKISSIRLARGYSQDYMANKLNIKQANYSKIESDQTHNHDEDLIQKIANILEVSVSDIKSPMPIVMNFNNSTNNTPYGTLNNNIQQDILDELRH